MTKSAYHEWVVEIPYLVEEVDLIFPRKQGGADTVYGRVSPTLLKEVRQFGPQNNHAPLPHLIVEATLFVQELHKLGVGLTTPEVEITNLEVTPD